MWNKNKYAALVCFVVVLAVRIWQHIHGEALMVNLFFEPFIIGWVAFLLPGMVPVMAVQLWLFHFEPWGDGHSMTTIFYMTLAAALFWFFPADRIARWFGTFDAFSQGKRRRPLLVRGVAHAFDAVNKRLFGRQKTGGWA